MRAEGNSAWGNATEDEVFHNILHSACQMPGIVIIHASHT